MKIHVYKAIFVALTYMWVSCVQEKENSVKKADTDSKRRMETASFELPSAAKGKNCSKGRRNKRKDAQDAGWTDGPGQIKKTL